MIHLDGDGAFANSGGRPLHRAMPYVVGGEDARHTRLQQQGKTLQVPPSAWLTIAQEIPAGDDVAPLVTLDLLGQPTRAGLGTDENEQGGCRDCLGDTGDRVFQDETFELSLPAAVDDSGVQADLDILRRLDLFYQVFRHAGS